MWSWNKSIGWRTSKPTTSNAVVLVNRFYLPSTTAADVSPTLQDAIYNDTDELLHRKLSSTISNTSLSNGTNIDWVKGTGIIAIDRVYVSGPLISQTVNGTVKAQFRAEQLVGSNVRTYCELYICNNAGTVKRGNLLVAGEYGPLTLINDAPTQRNKTLADGDTMTEVIALTGDRLVFVIGYYSTPDDSGNANVTAVYGDASASTDLEENETSTGQQRPWIEFSNAIRLSA